MRIRREEGTPARQEQRLGVAKTDLKQAGAAPRGFAKAGRCFRSFGQWGERKTGAWRGASKALPTEPTLQ